MNLLSFLLIIFLQGNTALEHKTLQESKFENLIPKELTIHFIKEADINLDGIEDAIIVCNISDTISNKPVFVFFGEADGNYTLKGRNDKIAFENFNSIAVTRNYFTIENRIGTNVTYSMLNHTFKVIANRVMFHRFDDATYEILDYDKGPELNHAITKRANEYDYPTFETYRK